MYKFLKTATGAQRYFQQLGFEDCLCLEFGSIRDRFPREFLGPRVTHEADYVWHEAPKSENPADWIMDIIVRRQDLPGFPFFNDNPDGFDLMLSAFLFKTLLTSM